MPILTYISKREEKKGVKNQAIFLDIFKEQKFQNNLQKSFRERFFQESLERSPRHLLSHSFSFCLSLSLHVNTHRTLTYTITVLLL